MVRRTGLLDPDAAAAALKARAAELGFDAAGIARADAAWEAGAQLAHFIAEGRHGEMEWMEAHQDRRAHPTTLWPDARAALVVAMNYGPDTDPLETLQRTDEPAISVYAHGSDYHDVLKKRLKRLAREFNEQTGAAVKVFVDTAPLMEKPLAALAGLGWQGKHTNLVSRQHGSWLFLGVMLTDAELAVDAPETDHCGSCRACLDICPTDAFPAPYQLDARKCIAYLTIELKGPIPREHRAAIGNRIYGCDDCLAVCPWNKFAVRAAEQAFHRRESLDGASLVSLSRLDDAAFRAMFRASPVKRTGRDRFVRNVLVALGNAEDASGEALPAILDRLDDPSPLVRGAAVWALEQRAPERFRRERAVRLAAETDAYVRAEWSPAET